MQGRMSSGWADGLIRFFKIQERGSTIGTEIRSGLVTFLTMSYILLVNPQILSQVGGPRGLPSGRWYAGGPLSRSALQIGFPSAQIVVATAMGSGVASIICGVFGNLPFGLAPGTGLSVYLTYGLVMAGVMTKEQGMAACLYSGGSLHRALGRVALLSLVSG
jgi:adenine/guanine/hypoxanthine permease